LGNWRVLHIAEREYWPRRMYPGKSEEKKVTVRDNRSVRTNRYALLLLFPIRMREQVNVGQALPESAC